MSYATEHAPVTTIHAASERAAVSTTDSINEEQLTKFIDFVSVAKDIFVSQACADNGEMRLLFAPCRTDDITDETPLTSVTLVRGKKCPELQTLVAGLDYGALGVHLTDEMMDRIESVWGARPQKRFFDLCGVDETFALKPWYSDRRQFLLSTHDPAYESDMDMDAEERIAHLTRKRTDLLQRLYRRVKCLTERFAKRPSKKNRRQVREMRKRLPEVVEEEEQREYEAPSKRVRFDGRFTDTLDQFFERAPVARDDHVHSVCVAQLARPTTETAEVFEQEPSDEDENIYASFDEEGSNRRVSFHNFVTELESACHKYYRGESRNQVMREAMSSL